MNCPGLGGVELVWAKAELVARAVPTRHAARCCFSMASSCSGSCSGFNPTRCRQGQGRGTVSTTWQTGRFTNICEILSKKLHLPKSQTSVVTECYNIRIHGGHFRLPADGKTTVSGQSMRRGFWPRESATPNTIDPGNSSHVRFNQNSMRGPEPFLSVGASSHVHPPGLRNKTGNVAYLLNVPGCAARESRPWC